MNNDLIIVGLGNPGERYQNTRHNLGFIVVDALLKKLSPVEESVWREEKGLRVMIAKVDWIKEGKRGNKEEKGKTGDGDANIIQSSRQKGGQTPFNLPAGKAGVQSQVQSSKLKTDTDILIIKPQTFMNASGTAVAKVLNFYKVNPINLLVIHDDLDLPFGKVKVVVGRGAAGHHGVELIINSVGTNNFIRIRLGVGLGGVRGVGLFREVWKKTRETENFVLRPFLKVDEGRLNNLIKKAVEITESILKDGVEKTMGRYN